MSRFRLQAPLRPSAIAAALGASGDIASSTGGGGSATTFDSLYSGGWAPNSGTDAKTLPTETEPAKSTNILTGGYRDQRYDAEIRKTTAVADQVNSTDDYIRHEYSRRQAFNCDSTRKIVQGSGGWWFLYDTSTNAVIPSGVTSGTGQNGIQGLAGDCEPIWHPTDPTKFWHTDQNGGRVWYERTLGSSGTAPASATLFDLTSLLSAMGSPWSTGVYVSFNGEGRPSNDGRWWCLNVMTSGFSSIGAIMYDRQTNTITGSVAFGGNNPNWVGTSPLGNYMVASWYGTAQASLAAEAALTPSTANGVWVWNQSGTFVRVVSVIGEHSDFAVDRSGNEVYVGISFHGNTGTPNVGWDGLASDGLFMRRLDTGAAYVFSAVEPYTGGDGFHISGCNSARNGWCVVSKYGASSGGSYGGTVFVVELTSTSPRIYRLAHSRWAVSSTVANQPAYWSEPHVSVNNDITRVVYASSFGGGDVEDYEIILPSWAIPT